MNTTPPHTWGNSPSSQNSNAGSSPASHGSSSASSSQDRVAYSNTRDGGRESSADYSSATTTNSASLLSSADSASLSRLGTLSLGTSSSIAPTQQPAATTTTASTPGVQTTNTTTVTGMNNDGTDVDFAPEDFGLTQDALPPYSEEAPPTLPVPIRQQNQPTQSITSSDQSLSGGQASSPASTRSAHSPRNPFAAVVENASPSPSYGPPLPRRPSASRTPVNITSSGSTSNGQGPSMNPFSGSSVNSRTTNSGSNSPPRTAPPKEEEEPVNEYVLKPIDWIDPATGIEKRIKIITQNENGPCPLLALCNTLILQGKVEIKPYDRPSIRYDHLLGILAEYLLTEGDVENNTSPTSGRSGARVEAERQRSRFEVESALRILPRLEHGLDVNVFFKSIRGFENTPELALFHSFGVELVHGWIVSPDLDPAMYKLVDGPAQITSYNKAVECIVSGDDAGGGWVVEGSSISSSSRNNSSINSRTRQNAGFHSSADDTAKSEQISHALTVQEFLNSTSTQLTHFGLSVLKESLPEGHLCAFFRNNHFCTLFKNPMDGILYTLVTDQSLAHELAIVWESLDDVDGAGNFLDGLFRHGALEVGDYARSTQPAGHGHDGSIGGGGGDEDFALALQLQQQEEEEAERQRRSHQTQNQNQNQNSSSYDGRSSLQNQTLGIVPHPAPGHYQPYSPTSASTALQQQHQPYPTPVGIGSNNGALDPYLYRQETDEEMAQRLNREFHQEYVREQQQQQMRQQQQQRPLQPRPQQQTYQQPTVSGRHSFEPARMTPPQQPQSSPSSARPNRRQRNSSDGSGSGSGNSAQKEKCIIM